MKLKYKIMWNYVKLSILMFDYQLFINVNFHVKIPILCKKYNFCKNVNFHILLNDYYHFFWKCQFWRKNMWKFYYFNFDVWILIYVEMCIFCANVYFDVYILCEHASYVKMSVFTVNINLTWIFWVRIKIFCRNVSLNL